MPPNSTLFGLFWCLSEIAVLCNGTTIQVEKKVPLNKEDRKNTDKNKSNKLLFFKNKTFLTCWMYLEDALEVTRSSFDGGSNGSDWRWDRGTQRDERERERRGEAFSVEIAAKGLCKRQRMKTWWKITFVSSIRFGLDKKVFEARAKFVSFTLSLMTHFIPQMYFQLRLINVLWTLFNRCTFNVLAADFLFEQKKTEWIFIFQRFLTFWDFFVFVDVGGGIIGSTSHVLCGLGTCEWNRFFDYVITNVVVVVVVEKRRRNNWEKPYITSRREH